MYSHSIQTIYEIFKNNISIVSDAGKSTYQNDPHRGFVSIKSSFEDVFLPLLASNNLSAVQSLINNERNIISKSSMGKSYKTYCNSFLTFLETIIQNKKYKSILKKIQAAYQVDGIESLVASLGGEKMFIQKSLELSYFFLPSLVASRFADIETAYNNNQPIPARWQGLRKSGIRPQCGYPCCNIDTNGNAKVRAIINSKTALTISAGPNAIFQNYKISHIWRQAFNPLYYSNFWNIVFVPAWANDLLDTPNPIPDSMESKMLNTYMAVCLKYYNMNSFNWGNIGMSCPSFNANEVVHGTYTFRVINPSSNGYPAPFSTQHVKV